MTLLKRTRGVRRCVKTMKLKDWVELILAASISLIGLAIVIFLLTVGVFYWGRG